MKNNHIIRNILLLAFALAGLSSCNDWLTILPQGVVVEQNFWEDRTDIEGVRAAAYSQFRTLTKQSTPIWGDLRSDALQYKTAGSSSDATKLAELTKIICANLDSTLAEYDWSVAYKTIYYCNVVLDHSAEIAAKDPQFTATMKTQMDAEMRTLRAMTYFYLVRTFRRVPYITTVVKSDEQVMDAALPQISSDSVITNCINDLEQNAVGKARTSYSSDSDTKIYITNASIYCLLSDMYLWRASLREGRTGISSAKTDYLKVVEYADSALSQTVRQYKHKYNTETDNDQRCNYTLDSLKEDNFDYEYLTKERGYFDIMYKNTVKNAKEQPTGLMLAFTRIFNNMTSDESILEVKFGKEDDPGVVNLLYGNGKGTQMYANDCNKNKFTKFDMRKWFTCTQYISEEASNTESQNLYCIKWSKPSIAANGMNKATSYIVYMSFHKHESTDEDDEMKSNWIVYRMSDAILQKCEAADRLLAMNDKTHDWERVIRHNMNAIHRRWWVDVKNGTEMDGELEKSFADTTNNVITYYDPIPLDTHDPDAILDIVMDERMLEFMGEGKRWFDLVRYAERKATTDDADLSSNDMMSKYIQPAYSKMYSTILSRSKNMWGLYGPVYKTEMIASKILKQNPVWYNAKGY